MHLEENLEQLTGNLETIKMSLENEIQFATMWLGEAIDFLNNRDINMALWAYSQFVKLLDKINIELYRQTGKVLHERLLEIKSAMEEGQQ